MKIKKITVLTILTLLIGSFIFPVSSVETSSEPIIINLFETDEKIQISYQINNFESEYVYIDGIEYSIINIGEESNILEKGFPDIPNICRSVIIPDSSKMKVEIKSTDYNDYKNVLIAPSKGNLYRDIDPDDVAYEFGDVYNIDSWYPENIVKLRDPYILRDFRGQTVEIYPVQYNPVKKIMRVYSQINIDIVRDGQDTINCICREDLPNSVDRTYKDIYRNHFINFAKSSRYDPVGEQGNMIVISYDDFIDEMQDFIDWKTMKGIPIEIFKVSEIGNANAIKTFIQNYYDDYGLTFVLLVGDAAQVPTLSTGYYASDPSYTYVAGGDHYPDLFLGRFSAQTADHVLTQVERSVEYEKNPLSSGEWYHKGTGVASNQGPGDDGEYDNQHMDIIRDDLLAYTYSEVDQIYDPSATATMVINALNDGRSIVNYCGHGSPSSWGSSGFNVNNINTLVNDNMLPYVTCVACNNGQFDDYDECFCEAWLRATNNGEPTGGILATGSSKGMSWNPPMDAQDEFIDILIESYPDNILHTIGAIHYNGLMHMNDEYGASGYSETDTWHVFGDPSIQIRTDTPSSMNVIHSDEIEEEANSFDVEVQGIEGALCALSRDGELCGYEYTNQDGLALIQLSEPVIGEDPLTLVVTSYNMNPCIQDITVNVNDPPIIPNKPSGPIDIKTGEIYSYITSTTDPNLDEIYYKWDWGDGSESDWLGPYSTGEAITTANSWDSPSEYSIKVKAKDSQGDESDWSDDLEITVTKTRSTERTFFKSLFEKFPNLLKIFVYILGF